MRKNKLIKILNSKKKNNFYLIGETAFHHQGDLDYLYRMVNDLSELKIDAVKFHLLLDPEGYMQKTHPLLKELKKWIFNRKQWGKIIDFSNKKQLDIIVQCDDVESIRYINKTNKKIAEIIINI